MQLINRQLPPDHRIYLFSDLHEGAAQKHKAGVKEMVASVLADDSAYAICGGDIIEGICIDDKRYQATSVDPRSPTPLSQYRNAIDELMSLKGRILGILEGNHDFKVSNKYGDAIKELVCPMLDAPYGTYTAKFSIKDAKGKVRYKIFYTHGARSLTSNAKDPIQREANMKATLKNRMAPLAGDCVLMAQGHTHQLFVVEPTLMLYMADDGERVTQHYLSNPGSTRFIDPNHRWYCNTGSFLKLYGEMGMSGYAERAGYQPAELGYIVVHVRDYQIESCEKVVI